MRAKSKSNKPALPNKIQGLTRIEQDSSIKTQHEQQLTPSKQQTSQQREKTQESGQNISGMDAIEQSYGFNEFEDIKQIKKNGAEHETKKPIIRPEQLTIRPYLQGKFQEVIRLGLKEIMDKQPEDPVKFLGEFLLKTSSSKMSK